jgi:hypothetical protein
VDIIPAVASKLPELPDWADPGDETVTGELVAKAIPADKWLKFLGGVEQGMPQRDAASAAGISRYTLTGALRAEPKCRDQYEQARIAAVWKNWDYETVEEIMVAIMTAEHGGYLNKILEDRGLATDSFYYLMTRDPVVKELYEEAREVQAEHMADEMQAIADYGLNDTYTDDKGRTRVDQDVVQRSRLRVDTMKWRLSKLHHKRFGDKVQQDQNINLVVDHAERLEAARRRRDKLNAKRVGSNGKT